MATFAVLDFGFATTFVNSTTMTVFIKNTAPVLLNATIAPDPAVPGQTMTYTANISDVNGDAVNGSITYYNTTNGARSIQIFLALESGLYVNNTFTIPTDAEPGTWYANITFTDGIVTMVNKTTFTVSALTATRLQNTPINFGNQTVGLTAQRAENGTAVAGVYQGIVAGFPLIINNTGNIKANYSINGTDLVGATATIGAGNVSWNITATTIGERVGKIALTKTTPVTVEDGITAGLTSSVYFYLDTPNVTQQTYNGNISIVTTS